MCEEICEAKNFYIWLLQFFALLGLLALCLWLVLRPKDPSYSITFISVPQNSSPNDTITYNLEIENPNKDSSVYYDDIVLSFLFGQDKAGETTITSFHQGTGKTRTVFGSVNANPSALKSISKAISNATAELKVALLTRFRYKTWGIRSKFHVASLQGTLPVGHDGKLSGKKSKYKLSRSSKKLVRSGAKRH